MVRFVPLFLFFMFAHAADVDLTLREIGFKRSYDPTLRCWKYSRGRLRLQFQEYNHIFTVDDEFHALKKPLLPAQKAIAVTDEDMAFIVRLATAYERKKVREMERDVTKPKSVVRPSKTAPSPKPEKPEVVKAIKYTVIPDRFLTGKLNQNEVHTIFIDGGHGGEDPGASGYGFKEKDLALTLSKELRSELRKSLPGLRVKLTRDRDKFISLEQRCHIANESLRLNQNGLFISLHLNSWIDPNVSGFEVFYLNHQKIAEDARVRAVVKRENIDLKKKNPLDPLSTFERIFGRLEVIQYQRESKYLADSITDSVKSVVPDYTKIKNSKSELFFVLKGALMPAVLVELGFISNKKDLAFLMNASKRKELTEGIAKGISEFVMDFNRTGGFRENLF